MNCWFPCFPFYLFVYWLICFLIGLLFEWVMTECLCMGTMMCARSAERDKSLHLFPAGMGLPHYNSVMDQIVPLKCHFRFSHKCYFLNGKRIGIMNRKHAFFLCPVYGLQLSWKKKGRNSAFQHADEIRGAFILVTLGGLQISL